MIEVENLSKRYGEKLAVDGLDFVVRPGVVTGRPGVRTRGTLALLLGSADQANSRRAVLRT